MSKRSPLLITTVISAAIAVGLAGCDASAPYTQMRESAERAIVKEQARVASRFANVVRSTSPGEVTAQGLLDGLVARYVLLTDHEQDQATATLPVGRTVFALVSDANHSEINVYMYAIAGVQQGLVNVSLNMFACGKFTLASGDGEVSVADLTCPRWLASWRGEDAEEVSLTELVAKHPTEE